MYTRITLPLVFIILPLACKSRPAELGNVEGRASTVVKLDVPFENQRDNTYEGEATCNNTSFSMVLRYWAKKSSQLAKLGS